MNSVSFRLGLLYCVIGAITFGTCFGQPSSETQVPTVVIEQNQKDLSKEEEEYRLVQDEIEETANSPGDISSDQNQQLTGEKASEEQSMPSISTQSGEQDHQQLLTEQEADVLLPQDERQNSATNDDRNSNVEQNESQSQGQQQTQKVDPQQDSQTQQPISQGSQQSTKKTDEQEIQQSEQPQSQNQDQPQTQPQRSLPKESQDSSHSQPINQTLSPNIPTPTLVEYQSTLHRVSVDSTIPFSVPLPPQLSPVYRIGFSVGSANDSCWVENRYVQKQFGDFIKFEPNELGRFDQWPVEISDATYSYFDQQVVMLLSNGSLLFSRLSSEISAANQIREFSKRVDYSSSEDTEQVWRLNDYSLYSTSTHFLFIYWEGSLGEVRISGEGGEQTWTDYPLEGGQGIKQVLPYQDRLYLLKSDRIDLIRSNFIESDFINLESQFGGKGIDMISMAITEGTIVILDRVNGVIMVDLDTKRVITDEPLPIDRAESARTIHAVGNTLLIEYELYHKTYIAEIFVLRSGQSHIQLRLNKFYYRYGEMQSIALFDEFGLVYGLSEMTLFQHSVNRHAPLNLKATEVVYSAIYPKVVDVIKLDAPDEVKYILVEKGGVFVERLQGESSASEQRTDSDTSDMSVPNINLKQLVCSFSEEGKHELTVNYTGFCKDNKTSADSYCSKSQSFLFNVHSEKAYRRVTALNNHGFAVLILMVVLVLALGAVMVYRRRIEDRLEAYLAAVQRRNPQNNGMQSEMISMQQ